MDSIEFRYIWMKIYGNKTSLVLPEDMTEIGNEAFCDYYNLRDITIPEGVTSIGERAFCRCASLQNIHIPESVREIGDSAFLGCRGLADENGMVIVDHILFDYFGRSTEVIIPDHVKEISAFAFARRSDLRSVSIGNHVKKSVKEHLQNARLCSVFRWAAGLKQ